MDQILKELDVMTIYWDTDNKVVFAKWKKPGTIEQQKEATDLALDAMKAYGVKALLFDPTELGMFRAEFKTWLDTVWFPRALGLGLTKIANILPKSELAKMSLDQVLTKVDNFQSKYFDNIPEPKTWLKS
ncbi:MAG: hypothetical protein KBF93_12255 [Leptospiraceae bacterium]|nr:hypothetical protein [Leptospiraceae bacterium]